MSSRVIEIIVRTNDQTGGGLSAIQSKFLALEKSIQSVANRIKSFAAAKYSATISLIDRVSEPGRTRQLDFEVVGGQGISNHVGRHGFGFSETSAN